MEPMNLKPGDVVQISPECRNPMFAGCMMTVTEPKPFGAQGYVQALGTAGKWGGQAYYRALWDEIEFVGKSAWFLGIEE